MGILICANEWQVAEVFDGYELASDRFTIVKDLGEANLSMPYEAIFYLNFKGEMIAAPAFLTAPVFVGEVISTKSELGLPDNYFRVNNWRGFLKRNCWEIQGEVDEKIISSVKILGRDAIGVADVPGLVAATIVSMIVNEAFVTLKAGVSTKEEIDMAMKLGTNYPLGPFEWSELIGLENIYHLLKRLEKDDARYKPEFELNRK